LFVIIIQLSQAPVGGIYRELWEVMGSYGELWGVMGSYGDYYSSEACET
jgi:hypothetical protein